jgi:hypothetical protein
MTMMTEKHMKKSKYVKKKTEGICDLTNTEKHRQIN